MKNFIIGIFAILVVMFSVDGQVQSAEVKEYNIPVLCDFSGPYADIMEYWNPPRVAIMKWWSDTVGSKLGVKLVPKVYDTRYDPTVVASMWPGILSQLKPIIWVGIGGAEVAALQQRLPKDKVPGVMANIAHGFAWQPNQWVFYPMATAPHILGAGLKWYIEHHPEKRPVRIALMSSQEAAVLADAMKGMTHYINGILKPQGLAEIVTQEWIPLQPVDVGDQMKNVIDAKSDIIIGLSTTSMVAAALRAQQLHGISVPTLSTAESMWALIRAMKSAKQFEGHYAVSGRVSCTEKNSEAFKFYNLLRKDYGLKGDLNPIHLFGMGQGILAVRAIEHAAKNVGGANLTGEAVYESLATGTFTGEELMGILPSLYFTKEAPFPLKNMKVTIETVKDGKYQLAAPGWQPVPSEITKW